MVGHQEHRSAVDTAGERDADRLVIETLQPRRDLSGERADVAAADLVEIGGERAAGRIEEPRVDRIRIGTADEGEIDHVMRGDHAGVARMELTREAVAGQRLEQRVDAIGHVQCRPFVAFGQEVPHRAVHRSRQPDGPAFGGHEREGTVDCADGCGIRAQHAAARFDHGHVADSVQVRIEKIDDATDGLQHGGIVRRSAC